MKVNFNVPFLDKDNEPLMEVVKHKYKLRKNQYGVLEAEVETEADGVVKMKPVIVKDVVLEVLVDNYDNDANVPGTDKLRRHVLAQKVLLTEGELDLDNDEIMLIRELAGRKRPTIVVGRIDEALKGA